jgi:hypothetical protein
MIGVPSMPSLPSAKRLETKEMHTQDTIHVSSVAAIQADEDHFALILQMPFRRNPQRGSVVLSPLGAARWQPAEAPMETLQDAIAEHPHVAEIIRVLRLRTNEYVDKLVAQRRAANEEVRAMQLRLEQTRAQAVTNLDLAYEKESAGQSAARRIQSLLDREREAHESAVEEVKRLRDVVLGRERQLDECTLLVAELQAKLMQAQRRISVT